MSIRQKVTGVALVAGLLAGCGEFGPESDYRTSECNPQTAALMGDFALAMSREDEFSPEAPNAYMEVDEFIESHSGLDPKEMVDAYVAERTDIIENINLKFGDGILPEEWEPEPEQQPSVLYAISDKQKLIGKVDTVLRAIGELPPDMLKILDVKSIKIDNIYDDYTGHFDNEANEILIEFDDFTADSLYDLENIKKIRSLIAHELFGHAAHAVYCDGKYHDDPVFKQQNGDFEYIGQTEDGSLEEHYDQVPDELLAYGPERTFVDEYAATTVAEDFARTVEFTMEDRGLIQPGDADFGSPLQKKQSIAVERLDEMLPGFKEFISDRTELLRRDPANEIYMAYPEPVGIISIPPEILANEANTTDYEGRDPRFTDPSANVAVLNGAVFIPYSGKQRGGELMMYPAIEVSPGRRLLVTHSGDDISNLPLGLDQYIDVFRGSLPGGDVVVMSGQEYMDITKNADVLSDDADEFFSTKRNVNLIPVPIA